MLCKCWIYLKLGTNSNMLQTPVLWDSGGFLSDFCILGNSNKSPNQTWSLCSSFKCQNCFVVSSEVQLFDLLWNRIKDRSTFVEPSVGVTNIYTSGHSAETLHGEGTGVVRNHRQNCACMYMMCTWSAVRCTRVQKYIQVHKILSTLDLSG